jgi:hypothetical protein
MARLLRVATTSIRRRLAAVAAPPSGDNSLDFSDADNSMYIALF